MPQLAENQVPQPKRWVYILPLAVLAVLMVVFFIGLSLNPHLLPSPLIGKPAPKFVLPRLSNLNEVIRQTDLHEQVSLFNIWATWCVSCRQEHPILMKIAETREVPIYGLLYKDAPSKGIDWLNKYGDPYRENAVDLDGKIGIDWGSYGAPETFLIDKAGIVRYKHIGPISWADWQNTLLPRIKSLRGNSGV